MARKVDGAPELLRERRLAEGIDAASILSVASRDGALQGPPDQLAPLALPKDVNHAVDPAGVCL